MQPRIFQIGFNRCATKSIYFLFRRNGYRTAHWQKGRIAIAIEQAYRERSPLLTYVDEYQVFTDMEKINVPRLRKRLFLRHPIRRFLRTVESEQPITPIYAFARFAQLDKQYPGSKFILNTRRVDDWIASRLRFNRGRYRSCRCGDRVHSREEDLADCWRQQWTEHHAAVKDYFRGRDDTLLVFDIDHDRVDRIVDFVAPLPLDPKHWSHSNSTTPDK